MSKITTDCGRLNQLHTQLPLLTYRCAKTCPTCRVVGVEKVKWRRELP